MVFSWTDLIINLFQTYSSGAKLNSWNIMWNFSLDSVLTFPIPPEQCLCLLLLNLLIELGEVNIHLPWRRSTKTYILWRYHSNRKSALYTFGYNHCPCEVHWCTVTNGQFKVSTPSTGVYWSGFPLDPITLKNIYKLIIVFTAKCILPAWCCKTQCMHVLCPWVWYEN